MGTHNLNPVERGEDPLPTPTFEDLLSDMVSDMVQSAMGP